MKANGEAAGPNGFDQLEKAPCGLFRSKADLAREATLGLATIRRAEGAENETSMTLANDLAARRALEKRGRRVHRRERWWPRCQVAEAAPEKELDHKSVIVRDATGVVDLVDARRTPDLRIQPTRPGGSENPVEGTLLKSANQPYDWDWTAKHAQALAFFHAS